MDDFIAALLCLPFLILPSMVLVAIISSKIKACMMSVKDYISEKMQILKMQPTPTEVNEGRVKPLRFAEATGAIDKALQMLSQIRLPQ